MLTVQMGGKSVTTTNNKQVMKINGNEVEIERIGNSIYVNGLPINVIIAEKTGVNWKRASYWLVLSVTSFGAAFYLIPNYGQVGLDFVIAQGSGLIDLVMGYVN